MLPRAGKTDIYKQLFAGFLLYCGLLLALAAYLPGLGGSLHFDDKANLDWLSTTTDITSAYTSVFSGIAGPLGRPLALATFAAQAHAWPDSPEVFLQTNISLHLLNGALVAWLFYTLGCLRGQNSGHAALTGAIGGTLWLVLPILASSSLLIVQRMALLSTTFMLAGLIGYLYGRRKIERKPYTALVIMSLSIIMGGLFAIVSKENGALLPVYALAIEITLLSTMQPQNSRGWVIWKRLFLVTPTALLLVYLAVRIDYSESLQLIRGFNGYDRLLTEAHVLWQYLYATFLPNIRLLGPFHDDYPLSSEWLSPSSILAVGAWLITISAAITLRRKAPLFSFAVIWYLLGHSLESTTIPLEIYFEHRNYSPLIGPVFALAAAALNTSKPLRGFAYFCLVSYTALQVAILFSLTSLWGNPPLAAEMWHRYNANSMRATQYLAEQLQEDHYHRAAYKLLKEFITTNPGDQGVRLQVLHISCVAEREQPQTELIETLYQEFPNYHFQRGVVEALIPLYDNIHTGLCPHLNEDIIYRLAELLDSNPAYQAHPIAHHNLHILMAKIARSQKNLNLTMNNIEQALEIHYNINTLSLAVKILNSAGLYMDSRKFIENAKLKHPKNPLQAAIWSKKIDKISAALDVIENRIKAQGVQ